MLRRIIAALLLLPASFVVFRGGWIRGWRGGPVPFFARVVREGPILVRKGSPLCNLLVRQPMLVARDLVHGRAVRDILRHAAAVLRDAICGGASRSRRCGPRPAPPPPPAPLSTRDILPLIRRPSIRVVSFDVFDTLLTRPVLGEPRDIFHLVAARVDARHGTDFIRARWTGEAELGDPFATLTDIYAHMRRRHGWTEEAAADIMAEEIRCERDLLRPRPDALELFRAAREAGKRVIAVSDMYLPADVLRGILDEKGFSGFDRVYVSCDCRARKDDGALFDVVLREEGIAPHEMLHMGDNRHSDVIMGLSRNIPSLHLPSVVDLLRERGGPLAEEMLRQARRDPFWGMILAQAAEPFLSHPDALPDDLTRLRTMDAFGRLLLGPLTASLALRVRAAAAEMGAGRVLFALRDGFLPLETFRILRESFGGPEGFPLQAGRRACWPLLHDSLTACMDALKHVDSPERHSLETFLKAHLGRHADDVLARLSDGERALSPVLRKRRCRAILKREAGIVDPIVERLRRNARRHYAAVPGVGQSRLLVFDTGYSGSVARALTAATGLPADKIYCWESAENRGLDRKAGTRTVTLMDERRRHPWHLLLEEILAPCEGGCEGFDDDGTPIREDMVPVPGMRDALESAHAAALDFTREMIGRFGAWTPCLDAVSPGGCADLFRIVFQDAPWGGLGLFRDIVFEDALFCDGSPSLERKLESRLDWRDVFQGTGFDNPDLVAPPPAPGPGAGFRTGIHLHLHNPALAQEVLLLLRDLPIPFDCFVSVADEGRRAALEEIFGILPGRTEVFVAPNRGRDVAPWIVGTADVQKDYDLFCHIHGKESPQLAFGASWRAHLLKSLLRAGAAERILALFRENERLGCVLPPIYDGLREMMIPRGVMPAGMFGEPAMMDDLLRRMGLPFRHGRAEMICSMGTMLWYRPAALTPLFSLGLRYEDFPEEPIGVGGTLAHALERMPALVARRTGWDVLTAASWPGEAPDRDGGRP